MTKALILLVLVGCTQAVNLNTAEVYKRELKLEINGGNYEGVATVKAARRYKIGLSLPSKPDLLKITTCHRQIVMKNVGKYQEFDYEPVKREMEPSCLVEITALDVKGEHEWALVNFVAQDERLEAEIGCNGEVSKALGSYLCQARAGLHQTISFKVKVRAMSGEDCPVLSQTFSDYFEFSIGVKTCQYVFSDGKEFFRLITYGYNEVLIL